MSTITVLTESGAAEVPAAWVDGAPSLDAAAILEALGWDLKSYGLCRDDVCVPFSAGSDESVELARVAAALDRPLLVDSEARVAVVGAPASDRRAALRDLRAPDFTLPDLDGVEHSFGEWRPKKKLLIVFSSW